MENLSIPEEHFTILIIKHKKAVCTPFIVDMCMRDVSMHVVGFCYSFFLFLVH